MSGPAGMDVAYQEAHPDDDLSEAFRACAIFFMVFCSVAVALRLYARRYSHVSWKLDDYTIVAALIASYPMFIAGPLGANQGIGRHTIYQPKSQIIPSAKTQYSAEVSYSIAQGLYKVSLILFCRRIFSIKKSYNVTSAILMSFVIAESIALTFGVIFSCTPIRRFWNTTVPGHCIKNRPFLLTFAILNIILDLSILFSAMPVIWYLKTTRAKKWALSGVFLLGSLVCVFSIMRTIYIQRLTNGRSAVDPTWDNTLPGIWSDGEICFGITCACLPSLWPLIAGFHSSLPSLSRLRGSRLTESSDHTANSHMVGNGYPLKESEGHSEHQTASNHSKEHAVTEDVEQARGPGNKW